MKKVDFYPLCRPAFYSFDEKDVPKNRHIFYDTSTRMYSFLNNLLRPSDIIEVRTTVLGDKSYVCITFELFDHDLDYAPFTSYDEYPY